MPARLIFAKSHEFPPDGFVEVQVWRVPPDRHFPDGTRYSFVYLRGERDG